MHSRRRVCGLETRPAHALRTRSGCGRDIPRRQSSSDGLGRRSRGRVPREALPKRPLGRRGAPRRGREAAGPSNCRYLRRQPRTWRPLPPASRDAPADGNWGVIPAWGAIPNPPRTNGQECKVGRNRPGSL